MVHEADGTVPAGSVERPENGRSDRPWVGVAVGGGCSLADLVEAAGVADRTGVDALWLEERPQDGAPLTVDRWAAAADGAGLPGAGEVYTVLGALAVRTRSLLLSALPRRHESRAPSMVAKIVTGLDVVSHGRGVATVPLGPVDEPSRGPEGAARAVERLSVLRAVLEDEHPTFRGRFETVVDAVNRPAPLARSGVPVVGTWLGGPVPRPSEIDPVVGLLDALVVELGPDGARGASEPIDALGALATELAGRWHNPSAMVERREQPAADERARPGGLIGIVPGDHPDVVERQALDVIAVGGSGVVVDLTGRGERTAAVIEELGPMLARFARHA